MPKRIAAALLLMILQKVVSKRRRLREDAHPRPVQEKEEAEKGKIERVLNLQSQMPVLRKRVLEAQVPRINQSREAAKIGKPVDPANGEISANIGILLHANSLPKVPARLEAHALILTEMARPRRTMQTSLRQD